MSLQLGALIRQRSALRGNLSGSTSSLNRIQYGSTSTSQRQRMSFDFHIYPTPTDLVELMAELVDARSQGAVFIGHLCLQRSAGTLGGREGLSKRGAHEQP